MGYTEALQLGLGRTKEKQMQYLNSIASCADDLSRLIEELSLYNKLSTSRIICHPQPLPFSKVIRSFIAEDQDYLDSRKVHVTYDMDDSLIAMVDEKEFQRIIFNLLTNTIKYRDKDISEVRISLHVKGKYAEFMYTDDGPGVPKEKLPHIFEAFYRTDEARSKTSNGSFGGYNSTTNSLSIEELKAAKPQSLPDMLKSLSTYNHKVLYFGPSTEKELLDLLAKTHKTAKKLQAVPEGKPYKKQIIGQDETVIAPYDAKNIYMTEISNTGRQWNPNEAALQSLFNEYFGLLYILY